MVGKKNSEKCPKILNKNPPKKKKKKNVDSSTLSHFVDTMEEIVSKKIPSEISKEFLDFPLT